MVDKVVLVNEKDEVVGHAGKMEAHEKGLLHRAISVFLFDKKGRMLLQQRAAEKYHGAFLWTNTCCSHPHPGEDVKKAAERRLQEEMGISTPLEFLFSFLYRAEVENGLIEHELDHVFTGIYEGAISPDPSEVGAYEYREMDDIRRSLESDPHTFTKWFSIIFEDVARWHAGKFKS